MLEVNFNVIQLKPCILLSIILIQMQQAAMIKLSYFVLFFPSHWKRDIIIFVPKQTSPPSYNELRTLSLLTILSKILDVRLIS